LLDNYHKAIIALVAVVVIVAIVNISIVGSVLNPPQQKIPLERDYSKDIRQKLCEENYLELGHSSVLKCKLEEARKRLDNP